MKRHIVQCCGCEHGRLEDIFHRQRLTGIELDEVFELPQEAATKVTRYLGVKGMVVGEQLGKGIAS